MCAELTELELPLATRGTSAVHYGK